VVINYDTRAMHYYTFPNQILSAGAPVDLTDATMVGELPIIDTIDQTFGEMDRGQSGIIFGDVGGQVYHHSGVTDDGSSIANFFETGLQLLGEPRRFGVLQSVEHLFLTSTAAQDVSIAVGKSDYGEVRVLQASQTVAVGSGGPYETQHRLPGRLYSFRMLSSASVAVEWLGSLAAYTPTGLR
jgi:hypothetical protein